MTEKVVTYLHDGDDGVIVQKEDGLYYKAIIYLGDPPVYYRKIRKYKKRPDGVRKIIFEDGDCLTC